VDALARGWQAEVKLGLESEGCLLLEQTLKKKTEETHELGVKEEEAGPLLYVYTREAE
jgi:hypothetical protein